MTEQNGTPNNSFRMSYNCKCCGEDNNSTDADDLCSKCENDKKIKVIFEELNISGDIVPLEDVEEYWKRKLIEVFGKSKW